MRKTRSLRLVILTNLAILFFYCLPSVASPGSPAVSPAEIAAPYKDKLVMLRNFYCGSDLKFDVQGRLISGGGPGAWTLCRDMRIEGVKLEDGKLKITGQRIYLFYDSKQKQFRDVAEVADKNTRNYKEIVKHQKTSIEMELPPGAEDSSIQAAMDRLCYSSEQEFLADAPYIWKSFLQTANKLEGQPVISPGSDEISNPAAEGTFLSATDHDGKPLHVGKGVSAPVPVYTPDPDYTAEARATLYQGTNAVTVVVGSDGRVRNPILSQCLGMGLDEKTAERVLVWKFEPATKDGNPVAVQVVIEVKFNLY